MVVGGRLKILVGKLSRTTVRMTCAIVLTCFVAASPAAGAATAARLTLPQALRDLVDERSVLKTVELRGVVSGRARAALIAISDHRYAAAAADIRTLLKADRSLTSVLAGVRHDVRLCGRAADSPAMSKLLAARLAVAARYVDSGKTAGSTAALGAVLGDMGSEVKADLRCGQLLRQTLRRNVRGVRALGVAAAVSVVYAALNRASLAILHAGATAPKAPGTRA